MSYPYEDDLMFGSEAATCNQIQRVIIEGSAEPEPGPEPPQPTSHVYYDTAEYINASNEAGDTEQVKYRYDPNGNADLISLLDSDSSAKLILNGTTGNINLMVSSSAFSTNPAQVNLGTDLPLSGSLTIMSKSSDGSDPSSYTLAYQLLNKDGAVIVEGTKLSFRSTAQTGLTKVEVSE